MTYITKDEARRAAQGTLRKSYSSAQQILRESTRSFLYTERFDVFLSHAYEDAELILGVREILTQSGLTVYVDWIDDAQMGRESVTSETADVLRIRMRASSSLLFITTKSSSSSKWMPWELGYFDGLRQGFISILPLVDNASSSFQGQEYLGLYPVVENLPLIGGGSKLCVVEKARKGYRFLDAFSKGDRTVRTF